MRKLIVSTGKAQNLAEITKVSELTWQRFAAVLAKMPPETDDKASLGWYCPAEFNPVYRDGKNLVARHALTFDYDQIEPEDVDDITLTFAKYANVAYTTASHTEERPRLRVVMPLSRPVTAEEFGAVTRKVAAMYDINKLARESDKPAQMMFLPTRKPGAMFWSEINEADWIDVDAILGGYDDWQDRSEWPVRDSGDSVHVVGDDITPPDEKHGTVGDFCRAYRVPEAIDRFELPYQRGSSDDRWTYIHGSRPDGLRIYDDGLKAHSEHDTDPAHGQHNAFDLVRLHRFGEQDAQSPGDLPITEKPSYRAMCQFALGLPEIQQARISDEFEVVDSPDTPALEKDAPRRLAVPASELLSNPTKPRWLLRDRLERGVIALMAGSRGSYKSFIALDWAMESLAHGPVYVMSAEGMDFDRRLNAYLLAHDLGVPADLYVAQMRIDLNVKENIELIRQDCHAVHRIKPVLFVLDTFSKLSGALDENSNTDVKAFIGRLDNGLKRAFDATVLLITHTGHGEKTRARGASALEADTDAAYMVKRLESGDVLVSRERFKSSPELPALCLKPEVIQLGYTDEDGEPVSSVVMRPGKPPAEIVGRPEPKGLHAKNVLETARDLTRGGDPVNVHLLLANAVERLPKVEQGARDTRRQLSGRALQKLVTDNYLFQHKNNMISVTSAKAADEDWIDG